MWLYDWVLDNGATVAFSVGLSWIVSRLEARRLLRRQTRELVAAATQPLRHAIAGLQAHWQECDDADAMAAAERAVLDALDRAGTDLSARFRETGLDLADFQFRCYLEQKRADHNGAEQALAHLRVLLTLVENLNPSGPR